MANYILRRLFLIIPTLLAIMLINFTIVQFAPGGPIEQMIARIRGQATDVTARISGSDRQVGAQLEVGSSGDYEGVEFVYVDAEKFPFTVETVEVHYFGWKDAGKHSKTTTKVSSFPQLWLFVLLALSYSATIVIALALRQCYCVRRLVHKTFSKQTIILPVFFQDYY